MVPEDDDPGDPEEDGGEPDVDADPVPHLDPLAVAEAHERDEQEDQHRGGAIRDHEAEAERHEVPSDHGIAIPLWIRATGSTGAAHDLAAMIRAPSSQYLLNAAGGRG